MRADALLAEMRRRFESAGVDTPELDARLLLTEATGMNWTDLLVRGERLVAPETVKLLEHFADRHIAGEPVHRILGHREFYGLDLRMSAETLEPRPDTETLVEAVRPVLEDMGRDARPVRILDLGTGTGAIALALLSISSAAVATASDVSPGALQIAANNALRFGMSERFHAVKSDWFDAIEGRFDIIATNPPYIRSGEIDSLADAVRRYDPRSALDGGVDGLDAYRAIATGSARHLAAQGIVGVEIGYDQRQSVAALFGEAGFELSQAYADIGDRDRVLVFRRA